MSTPIGNAVAQREARPTLAQRVSNMGPELARALPKHLDGDRMARLALTLIRLDPKLGQCTPESFAGSLLTAAAVGVEVGTPEAYLVPYGQECTLIIGYQGYTKLFWQHPQAQSLDAEAVYEKDEFDYAKGTNPFLTHKPYRGEGGRGKVIFYYAAVRLSTGGSHFEVLTPDEVKALRGGKVGPDPRFKGGDPMRWMERKTAIRQVLKPMPKSVQLSQAIVSDERGGSELYVERLAENQPAAITVGVTPTPDPTPDPTADEPPAGVDTTTGEVTDPADGEWPPVAQPAQSTNGTTGQVLTKPMQTKIHAIFGELGITERNDKLRALAAIVGHAIGSSGELTRPEAKMVIDLLDGIINQEDPVGRLGQIIADAESRATS